MKRRVQTSKSSRNLIPDRGSLIKSPQIQSRSPSPALGPPSHGSKSLSKYSGKQANQGKKSGEQKEENQTEFLNLKKGLVMNLGVSQGGNSKILEEFSHLIVDEDLRLFFDEVKYMNKRVKNLYLFLQ